MHIVVIFNHPYEGSYCHTVLRSALQGMEKARHTVDLIHLDREGFNPVMTAEDLLGFKNSTAVDPKVLEYKGRLEKAEHVVLIFPIWWELMPAMTKGFIDKVIFPGVAYENGRFGFKKKWTKLNGLTIITTMNTASIFYRLFFGNAIRRALLFGTFWKIGYRNRRWINLSMVKFVSDKKRQRWLQRIERYFERLQRT